MKTRRKKRLAIRLRGQRPAKPNTIEDVTDDQKTEDTRPRRRNSNSPDLPPNENLQKDPDETYGDTEIPDRPKDL